MGFFKSIFKKKKGGTLVGNLIRSVASGYTGGVLGSGANMIPLDDEPQKQNVQTSQELAQKIVSKTINPQELEAVKDVKNKTFIEGLKQNIGYVIGGLVVLGCIVWLIASRKKTSKKVKIK